MKASELRIGNYVFDKYRNIESVFEISKYGDLYRINELDPDYYTSIPLTEEWLLKFGFENIYGEKYNPKDEFANQFEYILASGISHRDFICQPAKGWIIILGDYDDKLQVKYVQEFQNLFFVLKGKELKIK